MSMLSSTRLSPLQFSLAASWLFQGCGCRAAGGSGGDNRSWSVQIVQSEAGLGLDTLHRSVLSVGCFVGLSQTLLLLSVIKGSAIMDCWGWCLWTEPQLQLCSIFSVLMGTGEPGQQALLLPTCAISSTQPAQAVISSLAQLAFAALWPISSCKTPA